MTFFARLVDRYAPLILLAVVAITAAMIPGLRKVELARRFDHNAGAAYNELVRSVQEVRKTFDADIRQVVVSIEARDKTRITDPEVLELVRGVTDALKSVSLLKRESMLSLSTVKQFRSTQDGIDSEPLVASLPRDDTESRALEKKIARDPFYYGRLISRDFKTTLVVANAQDTADLADIHRQVAKALEPFRSADGPRHVPDVDLTIVGGPEISYQLMSSVEHDVLAFIALTVALILLSFYTMFRSWHGVVLPLLGIATGILWTMGIIGYYGEPISILSATLPVVLVVISSQHAIHIYHWLSEQCGHGVTFRRALAQLLRTLFSPLFMATLMTFVGGVSLMVFKIRPIQHFGLFTGVGTIISLFVSIVLIPSLFKVLHRPVHRIEMGVSSGIATARDLANRTLHLLPGAAPLTESIRGGVVGGIKGGIAGFKEGAQLGTLLDRALRAAARLATRRAVLVLAGLPLLLAAAAVFIPRIEIGYDNVSMLPKASPIRAVTRRLDKAFGGTEKFDILIDALKPSGALAPRFLERVSRFQKDLTSIDRVKHSFSAVQILMKLHRLLDPASKRKLPATSAAVSQYLFLLGMSETGVPLRTLVTPDGQKLKVTVTVAAHDTKDADEIYRRIEVLAHDRFGASAKAMIGGDLVDSISVMRYLIWGKIQNVLASILAMFLLICLIHRSTVRGFMTILVLPIGCILNFGLMGLAGIRLDFATAIITSFAMGLGVDFAIHLTSAVKERFARTRDMTEAIEQAVVSTGRVMVYGAACTIAGFGVLLLSSFKAIQVFAILMCFNMVILLVSSLIVLPAVFRLVPPEFITGHRRLHRVPERKAIMAIKVAFSSLVIAVLGIGIILVDSHAATTSQPEALALVGKAIKNIYSRSESAVYVMRLIDADGKESVRKMRVWLKLEGDQKAKLLIKFLEPADIRGMGLLNIIDGTTKSADQWLYLPALRKSRRIKGGGNSSESFLGSDFTAGDLSMDKNDWLAYAMDGEAPCGDAACHKLVGTVPDDADKGSLPYLKKVVLIRKDNLMNVRTEFYNQSNQLEKVMSFTKFHKERDNHWMADRIEMRNLLTNHSTVIEIQDRDVSKPPSDSLFTLNNLERN